MSKKPKLTLLKPKDGDKDQIAILLEALEKARTKNANAVGVFVVWDDDFYINFAGEYLSSYAGASLLHHEINTRFDEE